MSLGTGHLYYNFYVGAKDHLEDGMRKKGQIRRRPSYDLYFLLLHGSQRTAMVSTRAINASGSPKTHMTLC